MKQLSPDMVRLLSSSQVITSVVNVVKELMENSLDAASSSIDIKLENYGLDRIEVRDNGHGIKATDTPVMAVRHFTSKICSHDDLEHLETYGFRGEALGSICAVAESSLQVSVTTKTEEDDISTQYMLDLEGNIVSQRPSHLGQGTTVSVVKLFKNLPVRRQYYSSIKKCKDELKKVQDLLVAYAIIKPELRLVLVHNKVVVWQKAKVPDNRSALLATLGPGIVANLLHCEHCHQEPEIFLEGFFPKPGADYSSTSSLTSDKTFIFVNNRPVQHKEIMKLLRQHYTAQYTEDSVRKRYPTLMMKIAVSPSSVDVNLTPDKTQILLQNTEAVLTAVEAMVISFYGFRPGTELTTNKELSHETLPPTDGLLQTDDPQLTGTKCVNTNNGPRNRSDEFCKNVSKHSDTGLSVEVLKPSLDRQTSNPSSSSSVADDWFVDQIPVESNFLLSPSSPLTTETASSKKPQESPGDSETSAAETSKEQISAEDWSRGTALKDTVSHQPLLPVEIHQPLLHNYLKPDEAKSPSSSGKKMLSAITEKQALTGYDLISNRTARAPLSPAALCAKESRAEVLREKPTASLQDINIAVHQRWKNLGEEERMKYEEKARKHLELYDQKAKLASAQGPSTSRNHVQGQKRKAPLSNQQLLDQLFSAQPQKKLKSPPSKPSQPFSCSTAALRLQLQRLSSQNSTSPRGLHLVNRLASQSAWVILCGQRLMLLNPFRVEEALLFKRLIENNILPAVSLQSPIQLTDGNLGGAEYTKALCNMKKQSPELNGSVFFADPRLVANGFKVKLTSGHMSVERHLEVTAMADCVPFLGLEDLREILTAVLHRKAKTVQECRPLKITNYLQGEAVRIVRQLPTNVSVEDVKETVLRMEQQLGDNNRTCIHGRPFLQHLCDIPSTEQEAIALLRPLDL
ncbi:PMS1 protein homolog 1 isoform X2 [Gouania willdenowi]|uniref:PMS1 protein homolog 1 isoform X2 n=1 Tax=Gouania willdenowi TaxID=441366 RepID=UPI0010561647|nr:PMS1 protein homolog 1 isoform X2 [Gouania willdenowi]XP_028291695.1 PMS1 protein homolog 1 isoform X2 [Gouania willdenowi]XP_028291696.1 PMS1 protein homolog 1 isoform X2 [Gouania willdenowi]